MTIRITGMNSGLDTESIITELASARSVKVESMKKDQTRLSWKIDAWKTLNSKIYAFYNKTLDNFRFENSYSKKVTTTTNDSAVDVITGTGAVNGVQYLQVKHLAQAGYLTGTKLNHSDSTKTIADDTALKDIKDMSDMVGKSFDIKVGSGETQTITITEDMTIKDLTTAFSDQGLNATFDKENKRFFISSKDMGAASDFSITPTQTGGVDDADSISLLKGLGIYYTSEVEDASSMPEGDGTVATKIKGMDASIVLNGANFTSKNNTFLINGLTYTAKEVTTNPVVITTSTDTSGIYDMVKEMLTEYNSLVNEMDKLYNADANKSYQPLTSEEKDSMSDTDIKDWETKIKDSLLRRDDKLYTVSSSIKEVMADGIDITGSDGTVKKMYLSDFGIETLSYFIAAENEKYAYHIDGDSDDSNVSANADKLKTAIANDPDTVTAFFSKLGKNLYGKFTDLMARTEYSSTYTVYDNTLMKEQLSDYDDQIEEEQKRLDDYIDKWYSKFSKMETALAKLKSNESAISGMLGS